MVYLSAITIKDYKMLSFFRGETITILRKTFINVFDDWGLPKTNVEEIEINAVVAFRNSSLVEDIEANAFDTEMKLIFSEGTTIYPEDIFIVRDTLWVKDGESLQPQNIFKRKLMEPPVVVNIKQFKGNVGQLENTQEGYIKENEGS